MMSQLEEIAIWTLASIKSEPKFSRIDQIIPIENYPHTETTPPGINRVINYYHDIYNKKRCWPSNIIEIIEKYDQEIIPSIEDNLKDTITPSIEDNHLPLIRDNLKDLDHKITSSIEDNHLPSIRDNFKDLTQKIIIPSTNNQKQKRTNPFPQLNIRKKRCRKNIRQTSILENSYSINPTPSSETKAELATLLGLSMRQITIWFQNKRAKVRRELRKKQYIKIEI